MQEPVLVTGAGGRLARFVADALAGRQVVALTRRALDISDARMVRAAIAEARPAVVINCAGYNDVEAAEDDAAGALAGNAFGVRNLAEAAARSGARLVHYSTDFVFDGEADRPYVEADATRPRSVYAASKWLGERFALEAPRAIVLRVESLFGCPADWTGPRGSLDAIVERLRAGEDVRAFTDRVVTPSYMADVAAATRHLIDVEADAGLYHCVNSGADTWERVAAEAARVLGLPARITPITLQDVRMRAPRPRYCALSNARLAAAGFPMPAWQDALQRWLGPMAGTAPPGSPRA
ncbi:MAG: NAD(P)-dependent oxidoreductase [Vicinamibacterales bacterium]